MRSVPSFKLLSCFPPHSHGCYAPKLCRSSQSCLCSASDLPPRHLFMKSLCFTSFSIQSFLKTFAHVDRWRQLKTEETSKHFHKDRFLYTATAPRLCFQRGLPMSQHEQCYPYLSILFPSLTWSSSKSLWLSEMRLISILCEVKRVEVLFVLLTTMPLSILHQTCVNLYWRKNNTNDSPTTECTPSSVFQ